MIRCEEKSARTEEERVRDEESGEGTPWKRREREKWRGRNHRPKNVVDVQGAEERRMAEREKLDGEGNRRQHSRERRCYSELTTELVGHRGVGKTASAHTA